MIDLGNSPAEYGFTFGASETATEWTDRQRLPWIRLVEILTDHKPGRKEGRCIVPAMFSGTSRKKEEAQQIDVAFLDSDTGVPMAEIAAAIARNGWAGVISSTHSHMSRRSEAKASNWDRYFAKSLGSTPEDFLREEKGYRPDVARGATTAETIDGRVQIDHLPCPKFRVVIPLDRPWKASDYPSQAVANAAWKAAVEALAAALALPHDQSCTDTSRLFYLPRRPARGAAAETEIVEGAPCDIFALVKPAPDLLNGHARPATNGHAPSAETFEHADPATGEITDLRAWARERGRTFLIAKMLGEVRPEALTGYNVDNKVHIRCPNDGAHTLAQTDAATFVSNAGHGSTKGFVIHCRHAHCTDKDRLFFLRKMLDERWITLDDLTDERFHLVGEQPPETPEDPEWWHSLERSIIDNQGITELPEVEQNPGSEPPSDLRDGLVINPPVHWTAPAPLRQWLIEEWIPIGYVTGMYGDGGVGKSLIAQQLLTSVSLEMPWLGLGVKGGRAFGFMCEDDASELHRRQEGINRSYGVEMARLENLRIAARLGFDNLLMTFDQDNRGKPSNRFAEICKFLDIFRPRLVVLDTLADIFGGNEINRSHARQFIQGIGGQIARQYDCAVVIPAHPSASGLSSGSGTSGSTAWNNTFRSRLYITRPEDEGETDQRLISRMKSNYAPKGGEITATWENGAFTNVTTARKAAIAMPWANIEAIFSEIDRAWKAKDPWSSEPQTKQWGRYICFWAETHLGIKERVARQHIQAWMTEGYLRRERFDGHDKKFGLKVVRWMQPQSEGDPSW